MDTPEAVLGKVGELSRSVWIAGVVSAAFRSGLIDDLGRAKDVAELAELSGVPERVVLATLEVLEHAGFVVKDGQAYRAAKGVSQLAQTGRELMPGVMLHSSIGQMHALVRAAEAGQLGEGWGQDADVVRAQGVVSAVVTRAQMAMLMRGTKDWHERVSAEGARFLDVGAGAAGVGLSLCRLYPHLQVVGLEPFATAIKEGRSAVAKAGLEDRITLREEGIEQLDERDVYDGAYVAQMFFPDEIVEDGLRRVLRSLKPGAYMVTGSVYEAGPTLGAAMGRFTSVIWGGGTRSAEDVARLMREVGYADVQVIQTPMGMQPILGRRAS